MSKFYLPQKLTVLSPFFTLPKVEEILDDQSDMSNPEVKLLRDKKLHVLSDLDGKYYLINTTIKVFLEAFIKPRYLIDVINQFAEISHSKPSQIEETMLSFYNDMYKEGIIISQDKVAIYHQMMVEDSINEAHYNIGEYIEEYEVLDELNIRNASQLYLAKHPNQTDKVVIKTMIYPDIIPEKVKTRSWKKFVQEFKLMESLGIHPNICKLIELNESVRNPFAVIEHIEGSSLRSYIAGNELYIARKLELITEVLSAIAHVQNKRVIHGDIHLSNFLVNKIGQIKLIDFGLSNNAELKDGEIKRNGGVYECIPPERVNIKAFSFLSQRPDFRSEVFQLAVISFYILYGKYPFSGFTWKDLAENILNQDIRLESKTKERDKVPPNILNMLLKGFQKDPFDRFSDAQHMFDFLVK